MKSQKLTSCSSAQDLNADEMKQVSENSNQTHNNDDGKSGTGGIIPGLPDLFDNELKHQESACKGKNQYDPCSWSYDGVDKTGICNYSHGDKSYYCSVVPASGVGSGTGGLSSKQAACLNKMPDDYCEYLDDNNVRQSGRCRRDHWSITSQPLFCSQSIGSKQDENK